MEEGAKMVNKSIRYCILYFIGICVFQLILHNEVHWIKNLCVFIAMCLIFLIYEWTKTPYQWKKDNRK